MNKNKKNRGFTLIEILVVIGIIAILATIVIIAINPARQFAQARNTQRTANMNAILNAIGQNMADNKGIFNCSTGNIPTFTVDPTFPLTAIPAGAERIDNDSANADLGCLSPIYIPSLPFDPGPGFYWTNNANYDTGYYVGKDSTGRVTVFSPNVESPLSQTDYLSVTR